MGKTSITRKEKREGIKPGAHSMNPDRKVANQSKGNIKKCSVTSQLVTVLVRL